jgi:hypothetical protein
MCKLSNTTQKWTSSPLTQGSAIGIELGLMFRDGKKN